MPITTSEELIDMVVRTTVAYEQGVGHARRSELSNPYGEGTPEYEAWNCGREFAREKLPLSESIPFYNTTVAEQYIRESLSLRDWSCNPMNAARAGWEACRKYVLSLEGVDKTKVPL